MKHIIKNNGYSELYSAKKYADSITKTLYAVQLPPEQVKTITNSICEAIDAWLNNKHEVTSLDIRVFTEKQLGEYDSQAALVYKKYSNIW